MVVALLYWWLNRQHNCFSSDAVRVDLTVCSLPSHSNRNMNVHLWFSWDLKCVIPCMNIFHYRLWNCGITSTGAVALAEALKANNSLEGLKYVANTLIDSNWMHCRHSVGRGCLVYLRVTITDVDKIGHRRVLIYSTDVLKGKHPTCVTRVCSCGTRLQTRAQDTRECLVRVNSSS